MQAHGAYSELAAQYEAKYRGCKRRGAEVGRRAAAWDVPGLVGLCERLALLAPDEYRRCMWDRRKHLHAGGQHGRVYDGTDAAKWARAGERLLMLTLRQVV